MSKLVLKKVDKLLVIASGKGGVGKTTVTVNLALALQALGHKVGIFDADIYGPNVPLMLGVRRQAVGDGFVSIARRKDAPAYIDPLRRFGLELMSTGLLVSESQVINPLSEAVGSLTVQTLKDVKWGDLDYLLLDLPPSAGQPQQALLQKVNIDGALIVTTPQDMSLLDASRSWQHFADHSVPILGLVENMSYVVCPGCGEKIEIFDREKQIRPEALTAAPVLAHIPLAAPVAERVNKQHPLLQPAPVGDAAERFLQLAHTVADFAT